MRDWTVRRLRRCLFWAKNRMDNLLWGKSEGDGKQLTPLQSMASGFSAACLGPVATGPFDVVKVGLVCMMLHIPTMSEPEASASVRHQVMAGKQLQGADTRCAVKVATGGRSSCRVRFHLM